MKGVIAMEDVYPVIVVFLILIFVAICTYAYVWFDDRKWDR